MSDSGIRTDRQVGKALSAQHARCCCLEKMKGTCIKRWERLAITKGPFCSDIHLADWDCAL